MTTSFSPTTVDTKLRKDGRTDGYGFHNSSRLLLHKEFLKSRAKTKILLTTVHDKLKKDETMTILVSEVPTFLKKGKV